MRPIRVTQITGESQDGVTHCTETFLNPDHIIQIRPMGDSCSLLTTGGVICVAETPEYVAELLGCARCEQYALDLIAAHWANHGTAPRDTQLVVHAYAMAYKLIINGKYPEELASVDPQSVLADKQPTPPATDAPSIDVEA
jgi:uncharacterized protein YlzI (FlbEa/FlbD family)